MSCNVGGDVGSPSRTFDHDYRARSGIFLAVDSRWGGIR